MCKYIYIHILYYVMLYIILYYIILFYFILYYIILYYIILYYIHISVYMYMYISVSTDTCTQVDSNRGSPLPSVQSSEASSTWGIAQESRVSMLAWRDGNHPRKLLVEAKCLAKKKYACIYIWIISSYSPCLVWINNDNNNIKTSPKGPHVSHGGVASISAQRDRLGRVSFKMMPTFSWCFSVNGLVLLGKIQTRNHGKSMGNHMGFTGLPQNVPGTCRPLMVLSLKPMVGEWEAPICWFPSSKNLNIVNCWLRFKTDVTSVYPQENTMRGCNAYVYLCMCMCIQYIYIYIYTYIYTYVYAHMYMHM